jgi:hypothetical protein
MEDSAEQQKGASKEASESWLQSEYEQINQYGRTVYEGILRLAQVTFVINPALGIGYYYALFEKRELEIAIAGPAIALLGVIYNVGALGVYCGSHNFMEALLLRLRDIGRRVGTSIHTPLEAIVPFSYNKYWGKQPNWMRRDADYLTRIFLCLLIVFWIIVLLHSFFHFLPKR